MKEIGELEAAGVEVRSRLKISPATPLIMPYHIALDQAREKAAGGKAIGTTGRGIGPAYEDKVARRGIRVADLHYPHAAAGEAAAHRAGLPQLRADPVPGRRAVDFQTDLRRGAGLRRIRAADESTTSPASCTTCASRASACCSKARRARCWTSTTAPIPTSPLSNTTVGGALAGTGVGADDIDYVLGIAKAYATRVGGGPFPTELDDEMGQGLRKLGNEFGATTGRPRRCGWIDIVALKRAVAINGINGLCITKLDVLDGMDKLKVCIAYEYRGKRTEYAPLDAEGWDECKPVYLEFPGWSENTHGITEWRQAARRRPRLPARAGRTRRLPAGHRRHRPRPRRHHRPARSVCLARRPGESRDPAPLLLLVTPAQAGIQLFAPARHPGATT